MINLKPGTQVYLFCDTVDMRKGFKGLAALVANVLRYSGQLFVFRGKRGDYLKCLCWDSTGLCLFAKRLEEGKFAWPPVIDECMSLSQGQLALLIEGTDWKRTVVTNTPRQPTFV